MIDLSRRDGLRFHVAASREHETIDAERIEERTTMVGGQSLADLVVSGARVTIAFTDATRLSPDRQLVGTLVRDLQSLGVRRDDITLVAATGLHRPMTEAERVAKLGEEIVRGYRIVDHDAFDRSGLVELGEIDDIPVVVNRLCIECDLLLATGVVEPHQYAGYSGGAKTVVIGCAGEATITATHGAEMLDREGTRLGAIEGNPFQRFIRAAGERIGLRHVYNVLQDEEGRVIAAARGAAVSVHDHLASIGRETFATQVPPAHIAVVGVSASKGANLYQASRAVTYLALADRTPLLDGAPIVLVASIPEGGGEGTGEKRFLEMFSSAASPNELVERLKRDGFPGGAQRAYILAKALMHHPVIVAGADHPDVVERCMMRSAPDLQSALEAAERIARARFGEEELDVLVVENALVTMARVEDGGQRTEDGG